MLNFNKSIKKIFFILIIVLVIAVLGIIGYIAHIKNVRDRMYEKDYAIAEGPNSEIQEVFVRNSYYVVKSCVSKFYTYYDALNTTDEDANNGKEQYLTAIYNMLDEDYKTYKEITLDNIEAKIPKIEIGQININNMYITVSEEIINTFFVYGEFINTSTGELNEFSVMLKVDMNNKTFTILLSDYIEEKYGKIENGMNIEVNYPEKIEANKYNIFKYETISDEEYLKDLFENIRMNMLYDIKGTYEKLNEEYKLRRFSTFEKFEEYIKSNYRDIVMMKLEKYEKTIKDEYTQYTFQDSNGNYYIINETAIMSYTIILDTYTVDLPEFITKYNEASNKNKVALNIEKVKEAINMKDYEYVYNKLDESFRINNFTTINDFEEYLKTKLYEKNVFSYTSIEQKSNVYIVTITVGNVQDGMGDTKEMEIIMKLNEGTDFVMSFGLSK